MWLLEMAELWEISAKLAGADSRCDGCDQAWRSGEHLVVMVDRSAHRSYLIHPECETKLIKRLEEAPDD